MRIFVLFLFSFLVTACGDSVALVSEKGGGVQMVDDLAWTEFRNSARPGPGDGSYLVEGDIALDERGLRRYFDRHFAAGALTINRVGGVDDRWSFGTQTNITFCVSNAFNSFALGQGHDVVLTSILRAATDWSNSGNVKFVHVPSADSNCNPSNSNVVFDVQPAAFGGDMLALAFFPSNGRSTRTLWVRQADATLLGTTGPLDGILRHELGHVLGFRHEQVRPEVGGSCFAEDSNWRAVTSADSDSAMKYYWCGSSWSGPNLSLSLSTQDRAGVAAVYGTPLSTLRRLMASSDSPCIVKLSWNAAGAPTATQTLVRIFLGSSEVTQVLPDNTGSATIRDPLLCVGGLASASINFKPASGVFLWDANQDSAFVVIPGLQPSPLSVQNDGEALLLSFQGQPNVNMYVNRRAPPGLWSILPSVPEPTWHLDTDVLPATAYEYRVDLAVWSGPGILATVVSSPVVSGVPFGAWYIPVFLSN